MTIPFRDWQDLPSTATPLDAAELNLMRDAFGAYVDGLLAPPPFVMRTPPQSGASQIRIGDLAVATLGTVPPTETWTVSGGSGNAAFITLLLRGSAAAPSPRGATVQVATGTTSVTPVKQTDTVTGDEIIVAVKTAPNTVAPTPPAGWVQLYAQTWGGTPGWTIYAFAKAADTNPIGTFTAAGASSMRATAVSYANVLVSNPIDRVIGSSGQSGASLSSPAIAASTAANDKLIVIGAFDAITGTLVDPAAVSGSGSTSVFGPTLPALAPGTEYWWFKSDGSGNPIDIIVDVA